jgi:hypothetical protein
VLYRICQRWRCDTRGASRGSRPDDFARLKRGPQKTDRSKEPARRVESATTPPVSGKSPIKRRAFAWEGMTVAQVPSQFASSDDDLPPKNAPPREGASGVFWRGGKKAPDCDDQRKALHAKTRRGQNPCRSTTKQICEGSVSVYGAPPETIRHVRGGGLNVRAFPSAVGKPDPMPAPESLRGLTIHQKHLHRADTASRRT